MELIKCKNCKIEITGKMEAEYSEEINEFFCSPACAANYYFYYLRSVPVDVKRRELKIKEINGKLYIS